MKKIALLLAAAMVIGTTATTVHAEEGNRTLSIEYKVRNEPTYTVSIPASITMVKTGSTLQFIASDVNYLENEKIAVTIAGTDQFRNQMLLKNMDDGKSLMRYQIVTDEGKILETTGGKDQMIGEEVVSFTEDGIKECKVLPVENTINAIGMYEGSITFNIGIETIN